MNNYEYIIASLPDISREYEDKEGSDEILNLIHSQLDGRDMEICSFFESGFSEDNLNGDFYQKALKSRNGFVRAYFAFDLLLRNCKVRFINSGLGRPIDQDVLDIGNWGDSEERGLVEQALSEKNLLEREKALDNLVWNKSEELAVMHVFDLDTILSFLAKLNIVRRWLVLDANTGREMFRRLIVELKESYTI